MEQNVLPRLTDVGYIRQLLERHGFTFSKKLGQNFLINPSVCPRMAEACGATPDTGVLEIGPGVGVLTRELALRAGKVCAVYRAVSPFQPELGQLHAPGRRCADAGPAAP